MMQRLFIQGVYLDIFSVMNAPPPPVVSAAGNRANVLVMHPRCYRFFEELGAFSQVLFSGDDLTIEQLQYIADVAVGEPQVHKGVFVPPVLPAVTHGVNVAAGSLQIQLTATDGPALNDGSLGGGLSSLGFVGPHVAPPAGTYLGHQDEGFPLTYSAILHETVAIELPCTGQNNTFFNATVPSNGPGAISDVRVQTRTVGITGGTTVVQPTTSGQRDELVLNYLSKHCDIIQPEGRLDDGAMYWDDIYRSFSAFEKSPLRCSVMNVSFNTFTTKQQMDFYIGIQNEFDRGNSTDSKLINMRLYALLAAGIELPLSRSHLADELSKLTPGKDLVYSVSSLTPGTKDEIVHAPPRANEVFLLETALVLSAYRFFHIHFEILYSTLLVFQLAWNVLPFDEFVRTFPDNIANGAGGAEEMLVYDADGNHVKASSSKHAALYLPGSICLAYLGYHLMVLRLFKAIDLEHCDPGAFDGSALFCVQGETHGAAALTSNLLGRGSMQTRQQPSSHSQGRLGTGDTAEPANGTGDLLRFVQRLANTIRRSEGKLRKCETERKEVNDQWQAYQKELQKSFIRERPRHKDMTAKLNGEYEELLKQKEEAIAELQAIFTKPEDADDPWAELPSLLAGAVGSGTALRESAREQLMQALGVHAAGPVGTAAPTTPVRRRPPDVAHTPMNKKMEGQEAAEKEMAPANMAAWKRPTTRSRSRSQAHGPRMSVKHHTTGPVQTTKPGTLAQKLEEKRAAAAAEPPGPIPERMNSNEEDMLGALGQGNRPEDPGHGECYDDTGGPPFVFDSDDPFAPYDPGSNQVPLASAVPGNQLHRKGPDLGPRTDLEFWASGQHPPREQLARAYADYVRSQPVEHSSGEARPHAVPAELPAPGEAVEEIATVHVTMWVTTPYYEGEVVDAEMGLPTTVERMTSTLKNSGAVMPDYASTFAPVTPQLGADFGSFIAYPAWLQETDKVAVVIDSTAINGGVFGAYLENPVTREDILMTGRTYTAFCGGLIKIMPQGDLEVSAEEALSIEHGDAWVSVPGERLLHLAHRGRRVWGQVAVLDGIGQYPQTEPVIFLDLRGLALFPQWTQIQGTIFRPLYYETLEMPDLPGWVLMVSGVKPRDDGVNIEVATGDVLVFYLEKEAGNDDHGPREESQSSSGEGDPDDRSSGTHALPDSSDLSTPSPYDGPPRGPPPPTPTDEREDDRAPQDHLPARTIDLTRACLAFPRGFDTLWPLFRPWELSWMAWDFGEVPFNEAARQAMAAAISVDGILPEIERHPPKLLGAAIALIGVLGGRLLGADDVPWPVQGPAALAAEQIAVASPLLWIVQARAAMPWMDCTLHVDCLAAGRATVGAWAPYDDFAVKVHHLELMIRELDGIHLTVEHVKGHAGHGWNEVADAVAKSAAAGTHHYAQPPPEACRALCEENLAWVGTELAAIRSGALRVEQGEAVGFYISACSFNVQGLGQHHRYLEEQFDHQQYNIIMLQETRYWGVSIWVSKTHGLLQLGNKAVIPREEDISVRISSPRILAVVVRVGKTKVGLISAHCPHPQRTAERTEFLADFRNILQELRHTQCNTQIMVCGIDMNGRLPLGLEGTTGDLDEFDEPDDTGELCAGIMEEAGVWAPTTFSHIHQGEPATHCHHTGSESRIDYILLGGHAKVDATRSKVNRELDNGSPNLDHWAVELAMQGRLEDPTRRPRLQRPRFDLEKMETVEGKAIIAAACASFPQPAWEVHPDQHCQQFQDHMVATLQQHFCRPDVGNKASYIPDEVWPLRQQKQHLKWRTRGRLQERLETRRRAMQQWRGDAACDFAAFVAKHTLLYELTAGAIQIATRRIRDKIAAAKDRFLRSVAANGPQSVTAIMQRAKLATSAADRDQIWLTYFGEQEVGKIVRTADFLSMSATSEDRVRDDWSWELLPSVTDIEAVLRSTQPRKTAGLDLIPSDLVRTCPSEFACAIQPLYLKTLVGGRQPLQWRGGILYEAFKGSGTQCDTVMRSKINECMENFLHPMHCGSRKGMPTLFPSLFVIEHLRWCARTKQSAAIIFVDTRSAYYRLVRQIATGDLTVDRQVEALFHRFGLDGSDIADLRDLILSGGMLGEAGVPDPIRAAAWDFHRDSWFTTRYSSGEAICRSTAGSRPGASWADCISAVIYARILYRVHEQMEGECINFSLYLGMASGPFECDPCENPQSVWDTTWADDSAFALTADGADQLAVRTARVGSMVITARKSGRPELRMEDLGESLQIVPYYKHLGCMVDPTMKMAHESRHRTALAAAAYNKAKDLLLQNRDLTLATRGMLFRSAVVSTYHNLEVWIAKGKAWTQMSEAFSRIVRRLLCRDIPGDALFRVPPALAHWATDCWPLDLYARRSRISALVSLARRGPEVLWAMIQHEKCWGQQLCEDLRWLVAGDEESWPEAQAAAWAQWWHLLRSHPQRVKPRAQRKNELDFTAYKERAAVEVCLWLLSRDVKEGPDELRCPGLWRCTMCSKTFRKRAGLSVHYFKTHGRCAEYRRYIRGSRCECCGTEYWTTGRLEDHLRSSVKCVRAIKRLRRPNAEICPGYGSRHRRRHENDHYTPAPPRPGDGLDIEEMQPEWSSWQKDLHAAMCEILLTQPFPNDVEVQLRGQLKKIPLYPEEIREVVVYLRAEVDYIHVEAGVEQWTNEQYSEIHTALPRLGEHRDEDVSEDRRGLDTLDSSAAFKDAMATFDWRMACMKLRTEHGTRNTPLFQLPASWEAVWQQERSGLLNIAVVKAPDSFWKHPVAVPFCLFRELLNHCVRPPFEDMMKAVDDAATMFSAENFERQGLSKLFRVPGVQRFTENLNGTGNRETSPGRDAFPSMDSTDIETSDSLEKLIAQQVSNELLLLEMKEEWDELATYTPYFLVWGRLSQLRLLLRTSR
ncbi:unnamed protein product [Symbiodinium sp. CCMP2592]|nr:unnamed protein product [Symbiodinium sp. CCMP2592]